MPEIGFPNPYKENICVVGAAQVGKTEFCKKLVKMFAETGFNVIVYAPHPNFLEVAPNRVVRNLSQVTRNGLIIYYPIESSKQDFKNFMNLVYGMSNVIIVLDELHNFCSAQSSEPELDIFVRNCNNRNMGFVAIFQAPSEVKKFVIRNSMHRFCFFLDIPTDIDYMKKWMGPEVQQFLGEWPIESREGFYKKQGGKCVRFSAL